MRGEIHSYIKQSFDFGVGILILGLGGADQRASQASSLCTILLIRTAQVVKESSGNIVRLLGLLTVCRATYV